MFRYSQSPKDRSTRNTHSLFSIPASMQYNGKTMGFEFIKQQIYQLYQFTSTEKQHILETLEKNKNAVDNTSLPDDEKQNLKDLLGNKNLYMQWDRARQYRTQNLSDELTERTQKIIRYCNEICQSSKQIQWNHQEEIDPSYLSNLSDWYSAQLKSNEIDQNHEDLFSATHLGHTLLIELLAKKKYKEFAQLLDEQNELALDRMMCICWYFSIACRAIPRGGEFQIQNKTNKKMLDTLQNIFKNKISANNIHPQNLKIAIVEIVDNPRYRYIFQSNLINNIVQHLKNKNVMNLIELWALFSTENYSQVIKKIEQTHPEQKWMQNEYVAYCYLAAKLLELQNKDFQEQEFDNEYQFYFDKMRDLAVKGNKSASLDIAAIYKNGISIQNTTVISINDQLAQQWLMIAFFQGDCFDIRDSTLSLIYLSKPMKNKINDYKIFIHDEIFRKLYVAISQSDVPSTKKTPIQQMLYIVQQDVLVFIDWLVRNPNDIHHFKTKKGLTAWINIFLLDGPFVIARHPAYDGTREIVLNNTVDIIWQMINFLKATSFEPQWQTLADIICGKNIREKLFVGQPSLEQRNQQIQQYAENINKNKI